MDCGNHSFDPTLAESPWHHHPVDIRQDLPDILLFNGFGIDPFDMNLDLIAEPPVRQGFRHAEVGIVQLDILADESNCNAVGQ